MDRKLVAHALAVRLDAVVPAGFHVYAEGWMVCVTTDDPSGWGCTESSSIEQVADYVADFVSEFTTDVWPLRPEPGAPHPEVQLDQSADGFLVCWRCGDAEVLALPLVPWSEVGGPPDG